MTNKEIRYQIAECIATTQCTKDKVDIDFKEAMELMEERLQKLYQYFNDGYKKEMKDVDDKLDNIL